MIQRQGPRYKNPEALGLRVKIGRVARSQEQSTMGMGKWEALEELRYTVRNVRAKAQGKGSDAVARAEGK